MGLRGFNQIELAEKSEVSTTSLSRFFNEESDLRSDALLRVLAVLGADVEKFVKRELTRALGVEDDQTVVEDIGFLLAKSDPITRKTITDTLIARSKRDKSPEIKARVLRIKKYAESIETVRRTH